MCIRDRCQKTKVSVLKKDIILSVIWSTVVRLPSGLAHGRRTPEDPGSRPGFETSTCPKPGSACPHPRRGFLCPPKHAPGFFCSQRPCFCEESLGSACPHSRRGFLCPKKHAPSFFPQPKCCFGKENTCLSHRSQHMLGSACPHSRRGFLCPPKHAPKCFCAAKMLFWGNRLPEPGEPAAHHGGTGRPHKTNRFL